MRRAAAFAWPLLFRNLGVAAVLYVDVLAIRAFFGAEQGTVLAGRYDVAYRIAEQVVVFGFVLEFLAGPPLAAAAARGDPGTLARFYRLAVPPLAWAWGLGAALLVVLAEPMLALLGAHAPAASGQVLAVLAVAVALRGVANLETPVLDAHLLSRGPAAIFFVGFAVNLGADVALLHAGWGILGPAVGTLLGYGLQSALRAAYLGRRLGVPAGWPYAAAAPAAALLAFELLTDLPTWAGLVGWAVVAGTVLLGRARLGLVSSEGREVLALMRMPSALRRALEALHPPADVGGPGAGDPGPGAGDPGPGAGDPGPGAGGPSGGRP